jgi:ABC-type glycerol-3-phosphate transport system substrate-binding protein
MNLKREQVIILGAIFFIIVVVVLVFYYGKKPAPPPPVKLTIWGFEPRSNFEPLINAYKTLRPNVTINYEQIDESNYREKVLDGLSSGSGPDIFFIQSKLLLKDISRLYPVQASQFTLAQLRSLFPQVVEDDFVNNGNIYALPLSIDSLALFYNVDYFNKAGLVYPPKTWDDFAVYAQKLKILDSNGQIIQAGAAFGASEKNLFYATDILKLLLKQSGSFIFNSNGQADFGSRGENAIGPKVLNFYSSFANPETQNYTWPRDFDNSINSFASGKVAMIFAYQKDINQILSKNPYLNFKIALVPQFKDSQINYAYSNYWALTVSRQSKNPAWAWDFIIYATTYDSLTSEYLLVSKKPPASRSQISKYLSDPDLNIFASEALLSRSWQEPDLDKIREIFNNIIDGVLTHKFDFSEAIQLAEERANQINRNY